jgi:hypothetical protein
MIDSQVKLSLSQEKGGNNPIDEQRSKPAMT